MKKGYYKFEGRDLRVPSLAEEAGCSSQTVYNYLKRGYTAEQAVYEIRAKKTRSKERREDQYLTDMVERPADPQIGQLVEPSYEIKKEEKKETAQDIIARLFKPETEEKNSSEEVEVKSTQQEESPKKDYDLEVANIEIEVHLKRAEVEAAESTLLKLKSELSLLLAQLREAERDRMVACCKDIDDLLK